MQHEQPRQRRRGARERLVPAALALCVAGAAVLCPAAPASAQTIEGTLMEVDSDRPISLGLIILMTEAGDSVTSSVTDAQGRFRVEAAEPGSFYLIASAFGFKETQAGIFELGEDGSMEVEFRVGAQAMPIDGVLVELQRPVLQHQLITNGYVRRLQRGLGHFITPYDIEQAAATSTGDLFRGIPGVHVRTLGGGIFAHEGESVQFGSPAGYCTPTIYLDGVRLSPAVVTGNSLEFLVPLATIDAAEIYRRPAEIPIEYSATTTRITEDSGVCGVIVLWTKAR